MLYSKQIAGHDGKPERVASAGATARAKKARILAKCAAPEASAAKVAVAHGINANIVHGWRKLTSEPEVAPVARQEFLPVSVGPAPTQHTNKRGIDVELRRSAMTTKLTWSR